MKNWRNDAVAWLLMLSGLGTILLLMGSTFYVVIVQSLGWFNLEGDSHFSLEYWRNMLQDEVLQSALFYSVKVSLLGAFGSVIFAYPLALWLRKPMAGKEGIIAVLRAPMFIPGLVAAFLFVNIVAYHGIINELLLALGIISEPLRMQNDDFGWGVVILQIWKNLPFALILVGGAVNAIRNDVLDAASNLGASRWRSFTGVVVPLTLPAVQVTLILVFIGALGDFAFFSVAGPRNTYSLARLMQATAMEYGEWNNAAVIAVIIMVTAALCTLLIATLITPFATRKGEVK
ncbi:TPA: ABC transporter permease [Klebsiella aerogenes]|uniref:Spermidine/putrescine ABC transporter permease n=2 Tax=Salmonella enterica I TaxID=59201 RepID=A0A7Z1QBP0_SALET|nr:MULTISPECIES: ABC transporter permease [Enterobacteriaceae]EAR4437444.1 ABC transporter permease [Salmonella enterica]EDJ8881086.1 ABC transporter permease [Salmonella enterica subsp. diarizonae]EDX6462363.1 ABC transporter permease [Salmonella enterica subsp. diarizonae serovar 60:r:e,n,x,z15]EDX9153585.1 ABC transporter permease [Salmonella enterica subsp. enterica serovar Sandiego]EEJ4266238.1 ABC transporter permease [Salmonella enterica subsp. diarizonae serovar 50:r:z]VEA09364.1 sper